MKIWFFHFFWDFPIFRFFPRGFRLKLNIFGKKTRSTPNLQVIKVGVTPNPDQIFRPTLAARAAAEPKIWSGLGVTPRFWLVG